MKRQLEDQFSQWFSEDIRFPLMLRGARQVGKSHLAEAMGKKLAKQVVAIDFELIPEAKRAFESMQPQKILADLEVLSTQIIDPADTLLILDEIQLCAEAIRSLRYFKEKLPALAVVAAGSLLEFTLQKENFSFPVGRISYLYMHPMSFREFLMALDEAPALSALSRASIQKPCSDSTHNHLLELVGEYFQIGGMPAVVKAYKKSRSWVKAREIQSALLQSYRMDFPKYATHAQVENLETCWQKIPGLVGQSIKYVNIDRQSRSRDIKVALQQLEWAGLLHRVRAVAADALPISANESERPGKFLVHDIGIMQASMSTPTKRIRTEDLSEVFRGSLAEQFVGQELVAAGPHYEPPALAYWERSALNSQAEVDFVIPFEDRIIPIEVKAGKTGRLKSLQLFLTEKKAPLGVRISTKNLQLDDKILSVPFYMVSEIPRLISDVKP